jgi:hypothetical protein
MDYNIPNNNKILPFSICSALLFFLYIIRYSGQFVYSSTNFTGPEINNHISLSESRFVELEPVISREQI